VARKQYMFTPPVADPRASADLLWDEMRDELNITRESLEQSEAQCLSQASLIDMLRKELDRSKESQFRDQVAVTRMHAKLKAAALLIIDALKDKPEDDPQEPSKSKRTLQDLPPTRKEAERPAPEPPRSPSADLLPEVEDDQASTRQVVESIHKMALTNRWP
jgi:hypothetical protein